MSYTVTLWGAQWAAKSPAFMVIGTLLLLPIIVSYTEWSYPRSGAGEGWKR